MKVIVTNVMIDYHDIVLAAQTAAKYGVDMTDYLLKGTKTESWSPNEAKVVQTWIGLASTERSGTRYQLV